MQTVTLDAALP